MAGKILKELQQTKPFPNAEEELFLNIQRTADVLMQKLLDVLRPGGISATQYNILRILRGAGDAGVTCKEIGARMITRDPDVTRLLDRLERRKLVTRSRGKDDRRFVSIRITDEGLRLLSDLDQPIEVATVEMMRGMQSEKMHAAIDLLEELRGCPD